MLFNWMIHNMDLICFSDNVMWPTWQKRRIETSDSGWLYKSFGFYQLCKVLREYINLSPNWCHISTHDCYIDSCNVNIPILCWMYGLPRQKQDATHLLISYFFHAGFMGQSMRYILRKARAKHTFDTKFIESESVATTDVIYWIWVLGVLILHSRGANSKHENRSRYIKGLTLNQNCHISCPCRAFYLHQTPFSCDSRERKHRKSAGHKRLRGVRSEGPTWMNEWMKVKSEVCVYSDITELSQKQNKKHKRKKKHWKQNRTGHSKGKLQK